MPVIKWLFTFRQGFFEPTQEQMTHPLRTKRRVG